MGIHSGMKATFLFFGIVFHVSAGFLISSGNKPAYSQAPNVRIRQLVTQLKFFDKVFEESGPLGKGITVGKVQVCLSSSDRSANSIFGMLEKSARSSDSSSRGLAKLTNEICLSLLRKSDSWRGACSESKWFSVNDAGKAESLCNDWSNKEAAKFEKVRQHKCASCRSHFPLTERFSCRNTFQGKIAKRKVVGQHLLS